MISGKLKITWLHIITIKTQGNKDVVHSQPFVSAHLLN